MAAAEARTAWQRLANRYIVQEDAKRAPKITCCPSSSSKLQFVLGNGEGDNRSDNPASCFMPVNWNIMHLNLSPEAKWWFQLQPNFGHQNDFVHEQIRKVEDDCEDEAREVVNPYSKLPNDAHIDKNVCIFQDTPCTVSNTVRKGNSQIKFEHWYMEDEIMDWKMIDQFISIASEKDFSDLKLNCWNKGKTEPWWRISDKNELASLVANKSLDNFENCDLPPPKRVHISIDPFKSFEHIDGNDKSCSPFDVLHADHTKHSSTSQIPDRRENSNVKTTKTLGNVEGLNSTHLRDDHPTASEHKSRTSDTDSNKAQLLEALCHSQTRAREAETAAQKAYNDKENVIKLIFKQASHLFAYKQWLRLLQLETLYLQLKVKEQQISTLPSMSWIPDGYNKYLRKEGKKKSKCGFCRYIVAFAIGMSLAGASLLLGWTFDWLLPLI